MDYTIVIAPLDHQKRSEKETCRKFGDLIIELGGSFDEYKFTASYWTVVQEIYLGRGSSEEKIEGSLNHEILHWVLCSRIGIEVSENLDDLALVSTSNYRKLRKLMTINSRRLI